MSETNDQRIYDRCIIRVGQLEAENTKLRELVKQMHDHIKESCDICDEDCCSSWDEDNECCVYDTLAREVGVEVEG